MNRNLFELSEEEKNRIRGLHESYINKPGTSLFLEQRDRDQNDVKRKSQDKPKYKPIKTPNWRGENTGKIYWKAPVDDNTGVAILARKVGRERYVITSHRMAPNYQEDPTFIPRLDSYKVSGNKLPYPDNMVFPKWDSFPEAKNLFDTMIKDIIGYLNNGGKIRGATIKGSADSAAPTFDIPAGYAELDHNYGGMYTKESLNALPRNSVERNQALKKMNQYLADNRAKNYRDAIISEVKSKMGKSFPEDRLYIRLLPSDNYFTDENNQGEKRGEQYRGIDFQPNADEITVKRPPLAIVGNNKDKVSQMLGTFYIQGKPFNERAYVMYNKVYVNAATTQVPEIPGDTLYDGSIEGDNFSFGNVNYGKINDGRIPRTHSEQLSSEQKYAGPTSFVVGGGMQVIAEDGSRINIIEVQDFFVGFGYLRRLSR